MSTRLVSGPIAPARAAARLLMSGPMPTLFNELFVAYGLSISSVGDLSFEYVVYSKSRIATGFYDEVSAAPIRVFLPNKMPELIGAQYGICSIALGLDKQTLIIIAAPTVFGSQTTLPILAFISLDKGITWETPSIVRQVMPTEPVWTHKRIVIRSSPINADYFYISSPVPIIDAMATYNVVPSDYNIGYNTTDKGITWTPAICLGYNPSLRDWSPRSPCPPSIWTPVNDAMFYMPASAVPRAIHVTRMGSSQGGPMGQAVFSAISNYMKYPPIFTNSKSAPNSSNIFTASVAGGGIYSLTGIGNNQYTILNQSPDIPPWGYAPMVGLLQAFMLGKYAYSDIAIDKNMCVLYADSGSTQRPGRRHAWPSGPFTGPFIIVYPRLSTQWRYNTATAQTTYIDTGLDEELYEPDVAPHNCIQDVLTAANGQPDSYIAVLFESGKLVGWHISGAVLNNFDLGSVPNIPARALVAEVAPRAPSGGLMYTYSAMCEI